MGEIESFIKGLREGEYSKVGIDIENEVTLVDINNLLVEIEKIGIKEVCDTYCEEINFIANNDDFIQVYAVY